MEKSYQKLIFVVLGMPTRTEADAPTLKITQLNYHHSQLYDGKRSRL